ncbi:MAG: hypothetical protein ACJAZ3_000529 [Sphingobacteriales bacterium]|jgi:hypothetical protein
MKRINQIILTSFLTLTFFSVNAQLYPDLASQDCFFAEEILCNSIRTVTNSFDGPGANANEVNSLGSMNGFTESCLPSQSTTSGASSETNSRWFRFVPEIDGVLNFTLIPSAPADFDWVIYNIDRVPPGTSDVDKCGRIFENNDLMIATTTSNQKACNVAKSNGNTGAFDGAVGAEFLNSIVIFADSAYVIMINRFTPSTHVDFDLDFTATEPAIFDETPPTADPAGAETYLCTERDFSFTFNENILCANLESTGSDFILTNVATGITVPISGVQGFYCQPNNGGALSSDILDFTLGADFPEKGIYELRAATGTDMNTISDACNRFVTPNDLIANIEVGCAFYDSVLICAQQNADLTENSNGDPSWTYEWDLDGDGTTDATGQTITNNFASVGTQTVSLVVTKPGLAATSTFISSAIETEQCDVEISWPTAFTPGGLHPTFGPNATTSPDGFQMIIVNRWGEIVKKSADAVSDKWDGMIGGKLAPNGVYAVFGQYEVRSNDGSNIIIYSGTLTLIN